MFQIKNLTKRNLPDSGPWKKIKEEVLGKKYGLSVVFAPNALMKKLNIRYRGEAKAAAVLSFPLSSEGGEIFINTDQKRYSPLFLFIHALLHLKSFEHSAKMEEQEDDLMKKYNKHGARHYYRA